MRRATPISSSPAGCSASRCKGACPRAGDLNHKRSNIESAYSMIKGKFGSALRSKCDTGQINEALCKVLAHNICVLIQAMHALNIHPIFRDVQMSAGRGGRLEEHGYPGP